MKTVSCQTLLCQEEEWNLSSKNKLKVSAWWIRSIFKLFIHIKILTKNGPIFGKARGLIESFSHKLISIFYSIAKYVFEKKWFHYLLSFYETACEINFCLPKSHPHCSTTDYHKRFLDFFILHNFLFFLNWTFEVLRASFWTTIYFCIYSPFSQMCPFSTKMLFQHFIFHKKNLFSFLQHLNVGFI